MDAPEVLYDAYRFHESKAAELREMLKGTPFFKDLAGKRSKVRDGSGVRKGEKKKKKTQKRSKTPKKSVAIIRDDSC